MFELGDWSNSIIINDQLRFWTETADMVHLSGLVWPLCRINDPATPIKDAQQEVVSFIKTIRPGTKTAFLGLKHDLHSNVEHIRARDIDGDYISIPADSLIADKDDNLALAVFVGDCIGMSVRGARKKALNHFGWQEAADGAAINFARRWQEMGENLISGRSNASLHIGAKHLPLRGEALKRLKQMELGEHMIYIDDETASIYLADALNFQLSGRHEVEYWPCYSVSGDTYVDQRHASDRRAKAAGTTSHRDCYILL